MYISSGNRKMSIPTWSLPAKKTCPGSTRQCRKACYACKAEKMYKGVYPCRNENYLDSKREDFVDLMVAMIGKKKSDLFRIHESGDWYSQEYLDKWFDICKALPKVRFLAFTKSFALDYSNKPENLEIIWSVFPDSKNVPSTGKRAYAGKCGSGNIMECIGSCDNCGICWFLSTAPVDGVHFNIH
jgi:hypothetical protein